MTPAADIAQDDAALLARARSAGHIAAQLFERGDFSEPGFLLYGRLERLCEQGLLRFQSWSGDLSQDPGEVRAEFVPA